MDAASREAMGIRRRKQGKDDNGMSVAAKNEGRGPVAARLKTILTQGGIKARDLAQLLDTTPETVSRWRTGRVEPHTERLQRLLIVEWIVTQLSDLYSPEEARLWLFSPHRLLGGERPADRIQRGDAESVLATIEQLRDGAYV